MSSACENFSNRIPNQVILQFSSPERMPDIPRNVLRCKKMHFSRRTIGFSWVTGKWERFTRDGKKEGRKGMMGFSCRAGPCANEENWLGLLKPKIM